MSSIKLIMMISVILGFQAAKAVTPKIKKDYEEFQKDYETALDISTDKNKFLKEFKSLETKLKKKYTDLEIAEGRNLTEEGNQMALDLEMLEPLKIIAEGNASNESCSNAEFINELNNQSAPQTYDKVKAQIKNLCR